MKLAHIADPHLGARQYHRQTPNGINQREADVAQAFRADPEVRDARLIAFTAYSGLDRQAREAGFERYLQKPGDVSRLLSVVENAGL